MRALLDENLPVDLSAELVGHEVATVAALGWQGINNSELLRAAQNRFDVLLTMDRNLQFQQNIAGIELGILLVRAPSNRMLHLLPLVPAILEALDAMRPGEFRRVGV